MFSNETKIGLLTIVAISLLIWGYKYVKGKNMLKQSNYLYVQYDNVDLLSTSTPVVIQGLQVGIVYDIYFKNNANNKQIVEVILDIEEGVNIPKDAYANIVSTGIMGGKAVTIEFDAPCHQDGHNCAENGDYLRGMKKGLVSSILGDTGDMEGYMTVVKENMGDIVDTLKNSLAGEDGESKMMGDVNEILANLKSATSKLDRMLNNSSGKIEGLLNNMESITSNINASNAQIKGILQNAETFTAELDRMDLDKTVGKANVAIDGASAVMGNLTNTLANADVAAKELSDLLGKVGGTEGTLGKLINDPAMHNKLEETLLHVNALMQDIRLHPERYRRILSKKTADYQKPDDDPILQK